MKPDDVEKVEEDGLTFYLFEGEKYIFNPLTEENQGAEIVEAEEDEEVEEAETGEEQECLDDVIGK